MIMGQMIPYYASTTLYSPPFGRGGESGTFYVDVKVKSGSSIAMTVGVETKNHDETTWTSLGSFSSITSTGLKTVTLAAVKEQVRFSYTFSAGSAGDFFWCEFPAPMWQVF